MGVLVVFYYLLRTILGFPGGAVVKIPLAEERQVQSLGQKDPLEEEIATYSSILDWKTP